MQSRNRVPVDGARSGSAAALGIASGRISPFGRSRGHVNFAHGNTKPFYPPPPPPHRKFEILMEAGRLAAEYLISKGKLPPSSLPVSWPSNSIPDQVGCRTSALDRLGNSGPADVGPCRRGFNDEYNRVNSRRNGRGRRKFGFYNRNYSDWGRERGRNNGPWMERSGRGYSDSVEDEEEEDVAPGYSRDRRGGNDEVGSSVSGVAGPLKGEEVTGEVIGESDFDDTGSKASSCSARKDPPLEGQGDVNMNKGMDDDDNKVLNSDGTEVKSCESSELEKKDSKEEALDGKALNYEDESVNKHGSGLLKYCGFAKVPTKPRSALAHRNVVVDQGPTEMVLDEAHAENKDQKDSLDCKTSSNSVLASETVEQDDPQNGSTKSNPDNETSIAISETKEGDSNSQHCQMEEGKGVNDLSPSRTFQENNNVRDEEMTESDEQEKAGGPNLFPSAGAEPIDKMEEVKRNNRPTSFKIRDLNLMESPEITEILDDHDLEHQAASGASLESPKQLPVDFGLSVGKNAKDTNGYNRISSDDKVIQVIDLEDDSPVEISACDSSKPKNDGIYPNMENMLHQDGPRDVIPGIQDGYSLAISDYLGADICPTIQADLQGGIHLHGPEGFPGVDDPFYGGLGDIGFMEVWDQPPQDYEKFF
ncbi:uncharacterized protein At4g26450 isoform X2 [Ananas comosus]|uniref:Uncharacterized protein At4g26450 isoform X2 n=1 Tax=Ananas comosus TaxID=4615 RepID=A0A6P5H117_ANACO|nr:uncharacterized protein At4g26450 isoform X2 [Ananas comosus]